MEKDIVFDDVVVLWIAGRYYIEEKIMPSIRIGDKAFVTCDYCGKPVVKADKYGMWCEDECGREDSIKALSEVEAIMRSFFTPSRS